MRVEEFERVLRQAAADQPPVSPTAWRDVVRRARVHRAQRSVVALAALAGATALVSLSFGAFQGPRKGTALSTKPGPPTSVKPSLVPTTPVPTALTTVPTTVPSLGGLDLGAVPAGFVATSVTFASASDGWVLGGANCPAPPATGPCPAVLLRTGDGGKTWGRIPAPPVSLADSAIGSTGATQVRFGSLQDGWVFGPDLWATHDGGGHWAHSTLGGVPSAMSVTSLEAGAGFVHVAVLDLSNPQTVPGFRIESSPIARDNWQASPTTLQIGAGPIPAVQIVLQGQAGWAIVNNRVVIAGARLIHGAWMPWSPPCTTVGGTATLAAFNPSDVVAVCNEGVWNASPQGVRAYFSTDGGVTFHETRVPVPASGGFGGNVANPAPGTVVLGTTNPVHNNLPELLATFDGGATWRTVYAAHVNASGPWSSLGFTTATQGEAIFGSPLTGGQMVMTTDGGHIWVTVPFRSG